MIDSKDIELGDEINMDHDLSNKITDEKDKKSPIPETKDIVMNIENLNLWYGDKQALYDIDWHVERNKVSALIGPSGCGKSTLIRCLNRMNDVIENVKVEGNISYGNQNILSNEWPITDIRTRIGMIFQKPNPFPMSIYDNVAYGPRVHKITNKEKLDKIVEESLKKAAIWEEVKDRLDDSALGLSGGQQQRLCIARALAVEPEIILMDEPTSALDPIATSYIEDLINDLKQKYTVVIVTHNMQQAARISDYTGFMYLGKMIEFAETPQIFENPKEDLTERYITGRFG